jgi:hypothetical protein
MLGRRTRVTNGLFFIQERLLVVVVKWGHWLSGCRTSGPLSRMLNSVCIGDIKVGSLRLFRYVLVTLMYGLKEVDILYVLVILMYDSVKLFSCTCWE